jgi:hypothetical protein
MEEIVVFLNENWELILAVLAVAGILVAKSNSKFANDLFKAIKNLLVRLKESKKK